MRIFIKVFTIKDPQQRLIAKVNTAQNVLFSLYVDSKNLPCLNFMSAGDNWLWYMHFERINFNSLNLLA